MNQCDAFCFVSTMAAVHRKSSASVWIVALPTELGESRGKLSLEHCVPWLLGENNNVNKPVNQLSDQTTCQLNAVRMKSC